MLVNGVWQSKWDPVQKKDQQGRFLRQSSAFRKTISSDRISAARQGDIEALGVKLYVAYICPWATRTLIARSLLGLEEYIPVSIVDPKLSDDGWMFNDYPGGTPSQQESITYIHQLYTEADPDYSGRATVPVLWNTEDHTIINNESAEILRIFNNDLRPIHNSEIDLAPETLLQEIDRFNERIYDTLNNGVYRAGFASSQEAYQEAYNDVFTTLAWLENHFESSVYAVGNQLTESDIRLFVTLARFDVAYYGLFKTNKAQISDFRNLSVYMNRLLSIPAFSTNTNIDHIKAGYYSIKALNPMGIVPEGPELDWFDYLN